VHGGGNTGVRGDGSIYGVYGNSSNGEGVHGTGNTGVRGDGNSYGVYGISSLYGLYGSGNIGVNGEGTSYGVRGSSSYGRGVSGLSGSGYGGFFNSTFGTGLYASTSRDDYSYAAEFQGNTYCYNSYLTSDRDLKTDIRDIPNALTIIKRLKPKNYQFRDDGKYASLLLPKGTHYGLIAQDLEEVLPNLVRDAPLHSIAKAAGNEKAVSEIDTRQSPLNKPSSESINSLAVNYIELIPILIKGIQELQEEVEQLKQIVDKYQKSTSSLSVNNAALGQNFPNPFSKTSTVFFSLPKETVKASVVISQTGTGTIVKTVPLSKYDTQIILDGSSLAAGSYTYTLYVDGKKFDSKQMTVSR